ncbi:MAG: hypothetical protein CVV57_03635 [Tenericutes bacterium HGW-Tenericutes-2]|jgi:hypothetical protein|nr:MAG: hypothetical protein CVV57_03635 [Tenericutes bacterium HGW-Tenericutes-2]
MLAAAIQLQKTKKYIIQGILFFSFFILIYTLIDGLNMSYSNMILEYGIYLVVINILLNIVMSLLSALLMNLSTAMVVLKGKEGKGSTFGFFSIIFGIFTYGCTACVIAFLASVGIAFSVIALPLAGLPYKLISFVLIVIGLIWVTKEIQNGKCKVEISNN